MARKSSTAATGAPWKLPFDSTPSVRQHHRVVDGAGQFPLGDTAGVLDGVPGRAVHGRRAAQRVRVLHPGVLRYRRGTRRSADPASAVADPGRADRPGRLRTQRLQVSGEHPVGAQQRLDGHGRARSAASSSILQVGERHHAASPSMPSVPLISASPSFSASTTGVSPAAASAGRACLAPAGRVDDVAPRRSAPGRRWPAAPGHRSSRAIRTPGRSG